jgi:ferredoxin
MAKVPKVDPILCQGCGTCEAICPEVFFIEEDGLSHVIVQDFTNLESCIEAAVENCPEEAITYEEED